MPAEPPAGIPAPADVAFESLTSTAPSPAAVVARDAWSHPDRLGPISPPLYLLDCAFRC
jgi:hypothetical protein